jgi:uncharacterized protein (DUF169 family)
MCHHPHVLHEQNFLKAAAAVQVAQGVPNLQREVYDFRLDPFEPARVWYTTRAAGTSL